MVVYKIKLGIATRPDRPRFSRALKLYQVIVGEFDGKSSCYGSTMLSISWDQASLNYPEWFRSLRSERALNTERQTSGTDQSEA